MGLDTSHGCWNGAYSAFHRWRVEIAKTIGIPLNLMEAFYSPNEEPNNLLSVANMIMHRPEQKFMADILTDYHNMLPIKWSILKPDPLHALLYHSDCDGELAADLCAPIADRLTELLPLLHGDFGGHIGDIQVKTQTFIDGLRLAASLNEDVRFR